MKHFVIDFKSLSIFFFKNGAKLLKSSGLYIFNDSSSESELESAVLAYLGRVNTMMGIGVDDLLLESAHEKLINFFMVLKDEVSAAQELVEQYVLLQRRRKYVKVPDIEESTVA